MVIGYCFEVSKLVLQLTSIFLVGIAGGIFGAQILWPLLVERPLFYQYRLTQAPTYVTETKQIFVQENIVLQEAVDRAQKSVVAVHSKDSAGRIRKGSGLVLTSDGLILTLNELLPQGGQFVFLVAGVEEPARYQVLKRDPENNLALVKLELSGLSIVRFADVEMAQLGERIFLVSASAEPEVKGKFTRQLNINEGIISSFSENLIGTTMAGDLTLTGAPVFNIAGSIVGLGRVAPDGRINLIPVTILRSFAGL